MQHVVVVVVVVVVVYTQCSWSCDYCKDPTATKEHTKNGNFLAVSKKSGRYGSTAGLYGRPDPTLYGGGRWGHKK